MPPPEPIGVHAGHYPRQLAAVPPVAVIGSAFHKLERVRTVFHSCNFSLILAGRGSYRLRGRNYPVQAPCVLTQWPGEPMDYGSPDGWDEIYFIYNPDCEAALRSAGLLNPERPLWPMPNPEIVLRELTELARLTRKLPDAGWGDQLDLQCYRIVVETLVGGTAPEEMSAPERKIRQLAAELGRHPEQDPDWEELARKYGMSLSTLRRYWMRYLKIPPASYLADQRIALACRLLAESDCPIREIAARLNFRDPLYFSRFFRQRTGYAASTYRREHRTERT